MVIWSFVMFLVCVWEYDLIVNTSDFILLMRYEEFRPRSLEPCNLCREVRLQEESSWIQLAQKPMPVWNPQAEHEGNSSLFPLPPFQPLIHCDVSGVPARCVPGWPCSQSLSSFTESRLPLKYLLPPTDGSSFSNNL